MRATSRGMDSLLTLLAERSEALARIARCLLDEAPSLASLLRVEDGVLSLRSPHDAALDVRLWDDASDLGLAFGPWHTHGNIAAWTRAGEDEVACLVAIVLAVVDGEIVIADELGGPFGDGVNILDLGEEDALLELLTQRGGPDRVRIRTWSGEENREISYDSLR